MATGVIELGEQLFELVAVADARLVLRQEGRGVHLSHVLGVLWGWALAGLSLLAYLFYEVHLLRTARSGISAFVRLLRLYFTKIEPVDS